MHACNTLSLSVINSLLIMLHIKELTLISDIMAFKCSPSSPTQQSLCHSVACVGCRTSSWLLCQVVNMSVGILQLVVCTVCTPSTALCVGGLLR